MENAVKQVRRNSYLDIVKAFAIIAVVVAHCVEYGSGAAFFEAESYYTEIVFKTITSFHMPLFMLVSGYLFGTATSKYSWTDNILRKVKGLLIPIVAWGVVTMVLYLVPGLLHHSLNFYGILDKCIGVLFRDLWYLRTLLVCSVFVVLVHRFLKDSKIVYAAALVLFPLLPDLLFTEMTKFMYPFFVLGYFFRKENGAEKCQRIYKNPLFPILTGVLWIGSLFLYKKETYVYTTGIFALKADWLTQLGIDIFRCFVGLVGSLFALSVLRLLCKKMPSAVEKVLCYIGKNSLGVYIISGYINLYVLQSLAAGLSHINYGFVALESVAILGLSLLGSKIIQSIPWANRIFLGGR